jgi:OOP family OmpA-OmpF porin
MQNPMIRSTVVALFFITLAAGAEAQQDVKGSQDHPLFTRMSQFYISRYVQRDFDVRQLPVAGNKREAIEGKVTEIHYALTKDGKATAPTRPEIIRNYTNAIKAIGGMVVTEDFQTATMKAVQKNGTEVWAQISAATASTPRLIVVERGEMKQQVTATDMLSALEKQGRISLYINFETAKADIAPASMSVIDEVVTLLRNNTQLNVAIEGHTDNVGTAASNQTLSEARAQSVMAAIISKGIAAARLSAQGFGQSKPLSDNATEDGRAKNRRVELVRK